MELHFSLVVPVYNRPQELRELLESLSGQLYKGPFEVVVVEDGSSEPATGVVDSFRDQLTISYWQKPNTGPGDSRNFGMQKATGNYFILVDSDCLLPGDFLQNIHTALSADYVDCFGGRDTDHPSFTALQRAISFVMTSTLTTGNIRGGRKHQDSFQPRSFNMGLSRKAFKASGGFGDIHPGEDPDLSLRLRKLGVRLRYIPEAVVYHKRRIDLVSFFRQVYKFGLARPVLNRWHPESASPIFWFPTVFCAGLLVSVAIVMKWPLPLAGIPFTAFGIYMKVVCAGSMLRSRNIWVAALTLPALLVQFFGYGWGFLKSTVLLTFSSQKPQALFPGLFFKQRT